MSQVQMREALVIARAGLVWYQEKYPETFSECDNEALEQIDAALASPQSHQTEIQAVRLLLLKLEIERICDDVKYAKDAKIAIQKLDFSKAASQAHQEPRAWLVRESSKRTGLISNEISC